jgi:hypothetical protein
MPGQVACRDVGRRRAGPMGLEGWWLVSYLPARRARSRRSPVTVQRWPCRGAPLVVSSAEGATRRSVTVSRDRPAPQPLREQELIRAAQRPSQKVQLGPSQSEDWITHVRRRVVCQKVSLRERISGTPQPTGGPFKPRLKEFGVA